MITYASRTLYLRPDPSGDVSIIFRVDSIAQEENETLTLELHPNVRNLPTGRGVFFRNTTNLTIIDCDGNN